LSITVIVCTQVLKLPEASVALHVLEIVPVPLQPPRLFTSEKVIAGEVVHTSVAVAVPVAAGAWLVLHCIVTLAGQVIEGAVTSRTVTCAVQVELFPL
jgi:hypothetical protein